MFNKMTIGKKMTLSFGTMLLALFGLGYASWHFLGKLSALLDNSVHATATKMELSGRLSRTLAEMGSLDRGIVLRSTIDDQATIETFKASFIEKAGEADADLKEMRPLLSTDTGRRGADALEGSLSRWRTNHQELVSQAHGSKNLKATVDYIAEKILPVEEAAEQGASQIEQAQKDINKAAAEEAAEQSSSAHTLTLVLLVLAVLIGAGVFAIIRSVNRILRRVAGNMTESAEQVASAATQVSSASQSLAQGSSEQAASLEETSSSSAEINSMSQKNAENTKVAAGFMGEVDQRVTAANQTLEQMVSSMTDINTSSDKVSKIIKVIDEIAFQTNILALNAAVEAARAGEAGMGFAVVADEVRNLAQRCAQAAKDTASLIEESLSKSHDGMDKLGQVTSAVRSITESVGKVKTLAEEVQLGSQEQARGIEQISKAIVQMEQVTQKNAANAEESASASEELSAQAETMRATAGELQVLVGGSTEAGAQRAFGKHELGSAGIPTRTPPAAGASTSQSLKTLRLAVARRAAPTGNLVTAGKPDPAALPLDEDFKDF
jgi:methyl-accepting chemotaxis protein